MTGRRDKKDAAAKREQQPARQGTYFIDGDGIDREVITTDICRILGNDALVKPHQRKDERTGQVREGFLITAYRAPTSEQIRDLKNDSARWQEEKRKNATRGQPPPGGYDTSSTRQEIWGEEEPAVTSSTSAYPQQPGFGSVQSHYRPPTYDQRYPNLQTGGIAAAPGGGFSGTQQAATQQYPPAESYYTHNPPQRIETQRIETQYGVADPSQGAPRASVIAGSTYPSTGPAGGYTSGPQTGYPAGRGAASGYYPSTGISSQTIATGNQGYPAQDPYYGRAAATQPPESEEDFYGAEDEMQDYDAPPAPVQQSTSTSTRPRQREREPEQKQHRRHGHRS